MTLSEIRKEVHMVGVFLSNGSVVSKKNGEDSLCIDLVLLKNLTDKLFAVSQSLDDRLESSSKKEMVDKLRDLEQSILSL